jgi:hypothetical protein
VLHDIGLEHATWQEGDFNGDGFVNREDVNLLLGNWPTEDSVLPEPVLNLGFIGAFVIGRRPRNRGRGDVVQLGHGSGS